jgi:iron complex transport system ATP-binding protein
MTARRSRVWIAVQIAQDAECLLLDEPVPALDVALQIEALSPVHALSAKKGLGVIVVLHDMNMAARLCDEIIALHSAGRLIVRGTPDEVMTPQQLARIYGVEMSVIAHPQTRRPIALPA